MSLPYFVESGDYIVSPYSVARLRLLRREGTLGTVVSVRFRTNDGPDEELEGEDAVRLFETFRSLATPSRAPIAPAPGPSPEGLDAIDSESDRPTVIRGDAGHEANGTE